MTNRALQARCAGCRAPRALRVQVGALDAERARRLAHPPAVLLEDAGDVFALEAAPRLAQAHRRRQAADQAVERDAGQQIFLADDVAVDAGEVRATSIARSSSRLRRHGSADSIVSAAGVNVGAGRPDAAARSPATRSITAGRSLVRAASVGMTTGDGPKRRRRSGRKRAGRPHRRRSTSVAGGDHARVEVDAIAAGDARLAVAQHVQEAAAAARLAVRRG